MSSDIFKQSKVYGLIKIVHSEAVVNMDDNTNNMVSGTDTEGFVDMVELHVPDNVTSIKWNGLERVEFARFVVSNGNKVFQTKEGVLYTKKGYDREGNSRRKRMIELVACPTMIQHHVIMTGTKRIANCSFKDCKISSIILPEGLEEIGVNAFYMAYNLKSIVIPTSVKRIEPQSRESFSEIKYEDQLFGSWAEFLEFLLSNGFELKNGNIVKK